MLISSEIFHGCLMGETRAQTKFFNTYYKKLFYFCIKFTKNTDSAQEIVHTSFLKIFKNLHRFSSNNSNSSFDAWVMTITRNATMDYFRQSKKHEFLLLSEEQHEISDSDSDADEDLVLQKYEMVIKEARHLSKCYRRTFMLYYVKNLQHKEIARILGVTESTSKTNLHKAKQIMRKRLEDKIHHLDDEDCTTFYP